ncbi:AAA family ATPase [Vibrio mediterranei]|uniref:AAA family ATPase n=1 Tax=Vibrio mediterranei TaxID=689 RepID=UPI003CE5597D
MISAFAVSNYRSLKKIITPLTKLTFVTGPNGSGKSNLYRSLRLLSDVANGHLVSALAKEGGGFYITGRARKLFKFYVIRARARARWEKDPACTFRIWVCRREVWVLHLFGATFAWTDDV